MSTLSRGPVSLSWSPTHFGSLGGSMISWVRFLACLPINTQQLVKISMRYFLPLFKSDRLQGAIFYDFREAPLDSPPRFEVASLYIDNSDVCVSAATLTHPNIASLRWIYTVINEHVWFDDTTSFVGLSKRNLLPGLEAIINSPWHTLVLLASKDPLVLQHTHCGSALEIDPDWVQYQLNLDTLRLCNT